ncbi:MAG: B12-binding domain-containing radical SAM protein [Planctomycetes bacterium]|nr:B12-binding domain-containing radical SAM protein [Planctomycetota bacterium]
MRKAAGVYFPLGLGYVSSYVRQHGYRVRFFDPNVQRYTAEQIANAVAEDEPLLVGVSFMTPQFFTARKIVDAIKARTPQIPVALGGAHPSVMPRRTLEEIPNADYVVSGEGELTTLELLNALRDRQDDLSAVGGLAWRRKGSIIENASRPLLDDLDSLPPPDRRLIDQTLYHQQRFLSYSNRSAAIHTSRGCPGRCVFCASGHKLASAVRTRSIANVMEEIDDLRRRYDVDYLLIKDDTFTLKRTRVREFCAAIKQRHPGLRWHCMGRVNTVDEDILATMKDAGLNDIFYGIESGNDEILKNSCKFITTQQTRRAVEVTAKLGIRSYGAFILGLPGDTRETIEQTIAFACSLPLTMAGFSVLIPYPGTKVYEANYATNGCDSIDYSKFIASTGMHYVKGYTGLNGMDVSELPSLVAKAQRRFYMRPRQALRLLGAATPSMLVGYARGFAALVSKELHLRLKPAATP